MRRNTLAGRTTDNEKLQGFVGFGSASQAAAVAFYKNNGQEGHFARSDMRAVTLRMTVQSVFPHYRLTRTQPLLEILQRPCTTFVTLVAVVEPMQPAVPVSQQLIARRPIAAKCMLSAGSSLCRRSWRRRELGLLNLKRSCANFKWNCVMQRLSLSRLPEPRSNTGQFCLAASCEAQGLSLAFLGDA